MMTVCIILLLVVALAGVNGDRRNAILLPKTNHWKFRYLELENGLKTVLVQDPKATIAAGSVNVQVGSLSDPDK